MILSDGFRCISFSLSLSQDVNIKWQVVLNGLGWWLLMAARLKLRILIFVQTLMDGSSYYFLNTANITMSPSLPWRLYDDKSWQANRRYVIWTVIVCVTLLAGASALCFFFSYCCSCQKEREERAEWYSQSRLQLDFSSWWQRHFVPWEPPEESGWKNVYTAVTKQYRQTGWLLMSTSYLAGNLERGQRLYASMWRCVKDGCWNANKATLQLLGTFTQIRCD